jgi:hypothetical protein
MAGLGIGTDGQERGHRGGPAVTPSATAGPLLKLVPAMPMSRKDLGRGRMSDLPRVPALPLVRVMSDDGIDRLLVDMAIAARRLGRLAGERPR